MGVDLIEETSKRFVDTLKRFTDYDYHVLVVDEGTNFIIEQLDKDVFSEGVRKYIAFIRVLDEKHDQSQVDLPSIYMVRPSEGIVNTILSQMSSGAYTKAKVIFTQAFDPSLAQRLRSVPNVEILSPQIDFSFAPVLDNTYSIDDPSLLVQSILDNNFSANFSAFAAKIATALHAHKCRPTIFYHKSNNFAKALGGILSSSKDGLDMGHKNDKMIIFDTTSDFASLLIHSSSYLGLISELDFVDETGSFKFTAGGASKKGSIYDGDFFIKKAFSSTIKQAIIMHTKEVNEATKDSASAQASKNNASNVAENFLKQQIYGKKSAVLQKHGFLIEKAANLRNGMQQFLLNETEILCGSQMRSIADIRSILYSVRGKNESDKARFIILCIIRRGGISEDDFDTLVEEAKISKTTQQAIKNLAKFKLPVVSNTSSAKSPRKTMTFGDEEIMVPKLVEIVQGITQSNSASDMEQSQKSHASQFSFPTAGLSGQFTSESRNESIRKPRLFVVVNVLTWSLIAVVAGLKLNYEVIFITGDLVSSKKLLEMVGNL